MGFAYNKHSNAVPKPSGKPHPIEAYMDSNREEQDESVGTPVPQEDAPAQESEAKVETPKSEEWWSATESETEWGEPATDTATADEVTRKQAGTADVYFCGQTSLLPLNRALRAIAQERLTGLLRAFWEQEPIELLARDGEIVLVTTRDPDLYCSETPDALAKLDVVNLDRARAQQKQNGTPFFLTLAREESIPLDSATELMRQYGQKLFSDLWSGARVWVMFEKNSELLSEVADVPGDANIRDWALETLRLVENPDESATFDPGSIPAYTKTGFERVQKLKLTSDEAQFASQFNGARSVQQIAKNLRLDLKSARQLLFRFVALEIVQCWPGSTTAKPEPKTGRGRLFGRGR